MKSDILLIIPAYNEEANIIRVVENLIKEYPQYNYVVVNDGSTDQTGAICRERGYHSVDYPVNLGLAGAFQGGMKYAARMNYEYAMQYDGDGQHDPAYISSMLETAKREQCDIVIGSRFVSDKKPWTLRMMGSRVIEGCIKLTTGKRITDPTSGMRLFNRKMIEILSRQVNYGPEPDTISYLMKNGFRVSEVQVEMRERETGTSYLTISKSIAYMLKILTSILFIQNFRRKVK